MTKLDIYFHQTKQWNYKSFPTCQENIQNEVEELCRLLCEDNIIYFNDKPYCHINLPTFIYELNKINEFDLSKVYDKFQNELGKIVMQNCQNLTPIIERFFNTQHE